MSKEINTIFWELTDADKENFKLVSQYYGIFQGTTLARHLLTVTANKIRENNLMMQAKSSAVKSSD